jgi:hypothetical protein
MPQQPRENEDDLFAAMDFSAADKPEVTALSAIDAVTHAPAPEEAEDAIPLFTVTNPPGTVSVSALGDGAIDHVDLSADVTSLTESHLAEEILLIAQLATTKGQAAQHEFLFEKMCELGADDPDALNDLLEKGMELASPQHAAEAQARIFATRYKNA